jgi:hypothetical protein
VTVHGGRCLACAHANPTAAPRCPRCGGETTPAAFGPRGTIWATTTIHVGRGDRAEPYALAYVDLDDGPRVLAHVRDGVAHPPAVADRVRLSGTTALGDVEVEVEARP